MKLKSYLHQINPLFSTPNAALRLLRLFGVVLLAGILSGVYSYLLLTFNAEVSRRRSHMSSAIAEARTFFTTRAALLESLSLSAVRKPSGVNPYTSPEEIHVLLGTPRGKQWSIWLTERIREYLTSKRVNLLYLSSGVDAQVTRLYTATTVDAHFPPAILDWLQVLKRDNNRPLEEVWLANQSANHAQLYVFIRLDARDLDSGWLGLEMEGREVSSALNDRGAGPFMMFNPDSMQVFSNSQSAHLSKNAQPNRCQSIFEGIGAGWICEHLIMRKPLRLSNWQLVYSIEPDDVLVALWPRLGGALLFCLLSISLVWAVIRRLEQRFITPTISRIQALVESELFSSDVIQTAPVALCVLRRTNGQVVLENTLSQQWLGQSGERERLSPRWIYQAFNTMEPQVTDYFEAADGRHLYLSCAATRYKGEDVLLCAFSDISTRTQIEEALDQARQLADAANDAKTLFLATMSHEIRTPLYGVLGTLELLARTQLDAQQTDYLRTIEGSSATLLQLICDVLDVSKIEAGQLALELSCFSVLELTQEVIHGYAAAAHGKGLELYAVVDHQVPERVIGDVSRIRQILYNLLNNAVKFTDTGRIVLRVKLTAQAGERVGLSWQVSDTGQGITQEDQSRIFEPFYQTQGRTNVIAGTGLGLPICQRLTHLMNGTLRVVSEPGLGSSFSLSLDLEHRVTEALPSRFTPLLPTVVYIVSPVRELAETMSGWLRRWGARPQLEGPSPGASHDDSVLLELHPGMFEQHQTTEWMGAVVMATGDGYNEPLQGPDGWMVNINHLEAIHHAISLAQGLAQKSPEITPHKKRIKKLNLHVLVAEDNVVNRLILRDQLLELGCTAQLASDGEEALSIWHKYRFDMVLSDVNMPRINGYELARELRRQGCEVPIIGATANAMRGEKALCLAAGMNNCLVKPFTLQALHNQLAPYERTHPAIP